MLLLYLEAVGTKSGALRLFWSLFLSLLKAPPAGDQRCAGTPLVDATAGTTWENIAGSLTPTPGGSKQLSKLSAVPYQQVNFWGPFLPSPLQSASSWKAAPSPMQCWGICSLWEYVTAQQPFPTAGILTAGFLCSAKIPVPLPALVLQEKRGRQEGSLHGPIPTRASVPKHSTRDKSRAHKQGRGQKTFL